MKREVSAIHYAMNKKEPAPGAKATTDFFQLVTKQNIPIQLWNVSGQIVERFENT